MFWLHLASLTVIAVTWLGAWRIGYRCVCAWGVRERAAAAALGTIPATAGLIISVQTPALVSLFLDRGFVTPEAVAAIFVLLTLAAGRFVQDLHPLPRGDRGGAVPPGRDLAQPHLGKEGKNRRDYLLGNGDETKLIWVPMFIVIGMYALFLLDALTGYPTGYDGRHYHLPMAVEAMQSQSIDLIHGYLHRAEPENAMLAPLLLAFAGLERLITLFNVPNAIILAATIYALAHALGVSRPAALIAGCIALSIPIVTFQSFSGYIDLYAAVSWLLALLALTWASRTPGIASERVGSPDRNLACKPEDRTPDGETSLPQQTNGPRGLVLLAGLSAGVALGCKTVFLALVPLLGLVVIALEWIRPPTGRSRLTIALRNVTLFGLASLACSSFWFVRGTVQANNPIYPLGVKVAGHEVLPGFAGADYFPPRSLSTKIRRWWNYPWTEVKSSGTGETYSTNNALGAAYATFVPVGILAAILAVFRTKVRRPEDRWRLTYLLLALSGVVLLLTVFHEVPRYVLPQILVAVPLAAVLADGLMRHHPRTTVTLLTASLLATASIASLTPLRSFLGRLKDGAWDRAAFYQTPSLIDNLPPGTRVLNLGQPPMTYPLFGRNLSNDVVSGPEWAVLLNGKTISAQALWDNEIEYVYVRAPWPTDWPADLPVERIFDDTEDRTLSTTAATRIYRVLTPGNAVTSTAAAAGNSTPNSPSG